MTNRIAPWLTLAFVVALTVVLLVAWQSQLVAPKAPAGTAFEQERAFATLSRLLKEGQSHVAGSPENAVVRDRIIEEFRTYGYEPEVQTAFACAPPDRRFPGCARVENIIAVHKGTPGAKSVLVTAHYDSVPAGPGAADDGAGTAVVLELARTLAGRQTKNDFVFLITDAEEVGLRGALAFADAHPLMKTVGIVLNVEARGASGPSMMFETGPNNAALIDLYAKAIANPSANSLIYEIYKLLPNDTDFTVYSKTGLTGFNFAFSNAASLYHSQRDNLEYLDRDSLQHHGDNMFALAAVLADTDLSTLKATSDASYFDVFGRVLLVWPAAVNAPIALIALLGVLGLIVVHRSAFSLASTAIAVAALIATPLLLFGLGWLLSFPLGIWPGVHPLDHPQPWPARIALAAGAILVAFVIAAVAGRRIDTRALLLLNWLAMALLTVAVAVYITGASFLLIWPMAAFVAAAWIETLLRKSTARAAALVGFAATAFIWIPYLLSLELVLGFDLSHFKILVLTPFVLTLIPVFAAALPEAVRWPSAAALALVTAGAAAVASQTPAYALNHPRGLNITYYDDRAASPQWGVGFVGAPDTAYLQATGFPREETPYLQFGLLQGEGRFKPAPQLNLAPPSFTVASTETSGADMIVKGTLRGGRGGLQLGIAVKPVSGLRAIKVGGQRAADAKRLNGKEPVIVRIAGVGEAGIDVEFQIEAGKSPSIILIERSALPDTDEARALTAARPKDAAPVNAGDTALVGVTLKDWTTQKP